MTSIGESVFSGCFSLASFTVPFGVSDIGGSAFYNCGSLKSIIIPAGLTEVGEGAFDECIDLKAVYYGGTDEEEWLAIYIEPGNEMLTCTEVYYYSKSECRDGWHWHYDKDGVTPVVW